MTRRTLKWGLPIMILIGGLIFWFLTTPRAADPALFAGVNGDAARGETVFWAAGCASCHVAPDVEDAGDAPLLSGGMTFPSPFGTFHAPNISPDPKTGIGQWSTADLAAALWYGTSPNGAHYYPALPYSSYQNMEAQEIADLKAFLDRLPPSAEPSRAHEVGFPFNIRRTLGLWKWLFLKEGYIMAEADTAQLARGRHLVEGLAHCGACHTPRNFLGGLRRAEWLRGAPALSGKGRIPGLAPDQLNWSADEIAYYLETGFTPDFDSAGGEMAHVVSNMTRLPATDRAAIAAYIKALPRE